jgi:hypothetical protein
MLLKIPTLSGFFTQSRRKTLQGASLCSQLSDLGEIIDRAIDRMREEDVLFVLSMTKLLLLEGLRRKKKRGGVSYAEKENHSEVESRDRAVRVRNKDRRFEEQKEKSREKIRG